MPFTSEIIQSCSLTKSKEETRDGFQLKNDIFTSENEIPTNQLKYTQRDRLFSTEHINA